MIGKSRVRDENLHEFVSGQVFLVDGRHVGVVDFGQSPVYGLDFLVRGVGGNIKNIIKRRARGLQI
ncbi:hypothetical protein GLYMA_15G119400v4 [Glycine max]|uniref:Uncharacterized protein n=1 Tax=Glycine max TaxID=3847 RepID=A0A0R0GAK7_SOYBN|nr:hypothetical protein GYH30_042102 [Glycine max]KRH11599.1 hypothetical protein GLYMA_15G119400v4 [Glycine max]